MGTRATVGYKTVHANKEMVVGTYIHYDGYPDHTLVQLVEIIKRDGIQTALDTIVHGAKGWSILDAHASYGKPGYGGAYDDMAYPFKAESVNDKCFAPELFNRADADWSYVVDMEQNVIYVWKCSWGKWEHVSSLELDEIADMDEKALRNMILQYS